MEKSREINKLESVVVSESFLKIREDGKVFGASKNATKSIRLENKAGRVELKGDIYKTPQKPNNYK